LGSEVANQRRKNAEAELLAATREWLILRKLYKTKVTQGDIPMKDKPLANVRVAILATNGFEQSEMTGPRQALKEAGAQTTLIAPKSGNFRR